MHTHHQSRGEVTPGGITPLQAHRTEHASGPTAPQPAPQAMTPLDAARLFSKTVTLIASCGVEIRGLDVSAVEFHPPGAAAGIPADICQWCGARRHRQRQADGRVVMFDSAPPPGPYRCDPVTDAIGDASFAIIQVEEARTIGVLRDGVIAQRITDTLNSAHAKLSAIQANLSAMREDDRVILRPPPPAPPAPPAMHSTGDVCAKCGSSNLTWSGTCKTCRDCGDAGGCG